MKVLKILFLSFIFINCMGKWFRSEGSFQSAITLENNEVMFFGTIENRDSRYTPYLVDNFKDMLQSQIIELGYNIYDLPHIKEKEDIEKNVEKIEPKDQNKVTLSEGINRLFLNPKVNSFLMDERSKKRELYSSEEIKNLSKVHNFNFFLQGAVGNNNSGTLLQEDENSLVFLRVYNNKGEIIGIVNYSVSGRTLAESNLLREVCKNIATRISVVIEKKKI